MLRGIYQSTSALLAYEARHEALSTNLANLQTTGFKAYRPAVGSFAQLLLQRQSAAGSEGIVGPLGTDVALVGGKTDLAAGPLQETNEPLDLALTGPGFFTVETPAGPRYTRAGNFSVNGDGWLVTPDGWYVLDDGGNRLRPGGGEVQVDATGQISNEQGTVGRLGLVDFPAAEFLEREETGLLAPTPSSGQPAAVETPIRAGFLEGANVDGGQTMVDLIATYRAFEANQRSFEAQDNTLRQAVNDLARF